MSEAYAGHGNDILQISVELNEDWSKGRISVIPRKLEIKSEMRNVHVTRIFSVLNSQKSAGLAYILNKRWSS